MSTKNYLKIVFNSLKSLGQLHEHLGFEFGQVNETPANISCDSDWHYSVIGLNVHVYVYVFVDNLNSGNKMFYSVAFKI